MRLLFPTSRAHAYDFGFVRAPDWMDPYVFGLLVAFLVVWGVAVAARPPGVAVNRMYDTPMPPFPTWAWRLSLVLFVALMTMVFVGMGLARM
ncbi:MAG: hypothetical protein ACOZNI_07680 [Myxococcota bacterium]